MRRLEKFLLSKVEVWVVAVVVTLMAAGTVVFGGLVKDAAERSVLFLNGGNALGRGMLRVAEIPGNLSKLLFDLPPGIALSQRFEGQAGLKFADSVQFSRKETGYILLTRFLPPPAYSYPTKKRNLVELIDLSRRKTVQVWQSDTAMERPLYILPDGSFISAKRPTVGPTVDRVDACSNVVWQNRFGLHHSMEQEADGNFWAPSAVQATLFGVSSKFVGHGLLKFSLSGDVLTRISLADALMRGGYHHLLYAINQYENDPFHMNDIQPVLRDGPFWRRDDLFVSLRTNSVVLLYRPATDEIVWLQSGPWLHQHDVDIVSDHEISVFSNNTVKTGDGRLSVLGANEVYLYDFATGEARSPWREAMRQHEVRTELRGGATVFDDGSVLVEEHDSGRVLRLSADGAVWWSYVNRASDGRVYRLGQNLYLDAEYGAEVVRSLAACTRTGSARKTPVEPQTSIIEKAP